MKYDIDASLKEVIKRGRTLSIKRHRTSAGILGAVSAITLGLILTVFYSVGDFTGPGMIGSDYGAFLLSRETGGYVFIGMIFFVLGIALTLGVLKIAEKKKAVRSFGSESREEGGDQS